jgi:hypothetical protein
MATTMMPSAGHAVSSPTTTENDNGAFPDDALDSSFVTKAVTLLNESVMTTSDDFDPFRIGDASKHNQRRISLPSKIKKKNPSNNFTSFMGNTSTSTNNRNRNSNVIKSAVSTKSPNSPNGKNQSDLLETSINSTSSKMIPPRMLVKFKIHEEVSSVASLSSENEGASEVFVEGTVLVRKQCTSVGET